MFQVEAGCGSGGSIVIQSYSQYPGFDILNPGALELPPSVGTDSSCAWTDGRHLGGSVNGDGGVCPDRWDEGTWEFTVSQAVETRGHCDCSLGCAVVTLETCSVVLADGGGTFTCQQGDGGAPCVSHLTVVRDGGTDGALDGVDGASNPAADGPSDVSPGGS
jgi:hypothetical protein